MVRHTRPLITIVHHQAPAYLQRSILNMIKKYNWLPQCIIESKSVKYFQRQLQRMIIDQLENRDSWASFYEPMHPFYKHPLGGYSRRHLHGF